MTLIERTFDETDERRSSAALANDLMLSDTKTEVDGRRVRSEFVATRTAMVVVIIQTRLGISRHANR
ncbi:hypothetical protein BD410DRAFT_793315 [Rickenella mellea]|uniref:Uncharacterized protein n=1 Tax=Rickenella mellea TaxID=50990 RepID=A0A4Y7PSM1_9AGAM|nr:hypothetical protein BD410DRAFT_793315 [Rickenella mellea]